MNVTETLKIILGGAITAISGFLGGMDGVMYALIACVSIDYITGVAVAIKRKKLSSEIGFWGLVRKMCVLVLVGIAHLLDTRVIGGGDVFRTSVALYYIGNEGVSLIENIGNLGVPLPKKLYDVLKQLKNDNSGEEVKNEQKD